MKFLCQALSMILLLCVCSIVQAQIENEKSNLEILYVGVSEGGIVKPPYLQGVEAERYAELQMERQEAFSMFLEQHFEQVKAIAAVDYKIEMSASYDVTIFDAKPPVLKEIPQSNGWSREIRLPDDFSHPAIMVGEVGPLSIGRFGNGLLIDHL